MLSQSIFLVLLLVIGIINGHEEAEHTIKLNTDNFNNEIEQNNYFIVFFAPWCGHCQRLMPTFDKLAAGVNAKEDANVKIGAVDCTKDGDLCSEHEVTGYPTLRFFKKNSKESVKFRGTRDLSSLQSFIIEQLGESGENLVDPDSVEVPKPVSALIELTEDTFPKHVATGKHFIKFYAPWCGHCQKLAPTWQDLAQTFEHGKDVSISKVDCTQYRPICTDFDVKGYPTLLWIEDGKKIEKYSGSRAHEDLKAYVEKMSGHPKQEAEEKKEPPKESSSVVLQLTKDDFEHTIEKGVTMAKFYAPWCSHCKRMAPTYEQLAEKFIDNPNVKIAKIDCTLENNRDLCSEQDVNGFPTLFIYRNGEKLSEYNGSRSLDDMHDFIVRHLSSHDEL